MTKEELVEAMVNEPDGDKARAISSVIVAETESETEKAKMVAEEKKSKKDRILGYLKIAGSVLLAIITCGATIWNARACMKFEETGTIRTKAWTGVKPIGKVQEIR